MAIEVRAYPFPWTLGIFRDCLRNDYPAWVLLQDGELLGYFLMSLAAGEAHVLNVCVAPEQQGHGHGRKLMRACLQIARGRGAERVFLEVRPSNVGAIQLYFDMGFNEIGSAPALLPRQGRSRGCAGHGDRVAAARIVARVVPGWAAPALAQTLVGGVGRPGFSRAARRERRLVRSSRAGAGAPLLRRPQCASCTNVSLASLPLHLAISVSTRLISLSRRARSAPMSTSPSSGTSNLSSRHRRRAGRCGRRIGKKFDRLEPVEEAQLRAEALRARAVGASPSASSSRTSFAGRRR